MHDRRWRLEWSARVATAPEILVLRPLPPLLALSVLASRLTVMLAGLAPAFLLAAAGLAQQGPGLVLQLRGGEEMSVTDARRARLVALSVPEGFPVSPFVPAGPFEAVWKGYLNIDLRDRYHFSFKGRGRFELRIGDELVLEVQADTQKLVRSESIRIRKGANPIVASYTSPPSGEASARLYWSSSEFIDEPVPPAAFSSDADDAKLSQMVIRRQGRELFAALHCSKCHLVGSADGMPELTAKPPSLTDIGGRVRREWMTRWLKDPRSVRPEARMPHVLGDDPLAARDVAAFLSTLGSKPPPLAKGDADEGKRIFAELGCVACHTRIGEPRDPRRTGLDHVPQKWFPAALAAFLEEPSRYSVSTRMPDLGLTRTEARHLASFLTATARPDGRAEQGDVDRGRELVASSGCLACHDLEAKVSADEFTAPALADLSRFDRACLSSDPQSRSPVYTLAAAERAALRIFLASDRSSLTRRCLPEFAERRIAALGCSNCHQRDGVADLWSSLGEAEPVKPTAADSHELALPQTRPDLTQAGAKLRSEWVEKLLKGELAEKTRPWVRARMPAFAWGARELAQGLAMQHGLFPTTSVEMPPDAELVAIGRKLLGSEGGFACNTCHAVGAKAPIAVFEVQGTNFAHVSERLHKEFFLRWMDNPLRIDPTVRMPRYANEEGKTGFLDVLDGEAKRQFDAIWQYLRQGRAIK